MSAARALGIGELLWDELPAGRRLGGAPLNVVANLVKLGWHGLYATAVGHDEPGDAALEELRARGVDTSLVHRADRPTGAAGVRLDTSGAPAFAIASPAAYEDLTLAPRTVDDMIASAPAIVVFGTLAQRFATTRAITQELVRGLPAAVRLYDVNLRDGCWSAQLVAQLCRLATVLKLNDAEAAILAGRLARGERDPETFSRRVAERFGLRGVAITAGARAATLLLDGDFVAAPPPAVTVADTVGAGDAFAAGLADTIHRGADASTALWRANALGAIAASRPGVLPAPAAPPHEPTLTEQTA